MNSLSKRHVIEGLQQAKASQTVKWRDNLPTWCPGCGHFTPLHGLYEAAEQLGIPSKNFVLVSGIGCSGRFPFFIKGFGLHGLHGRAIPLATGIKLANPELTVVVVGGDGDGVGIGGGHFPHAARSNINLTYIMLDNSIYGLTKGQVSPTSPMGMVSATTPYGNVARPLNPSTLAVAYGATFVARVFSKDRHLTTEIIIEAIRHRGFSFVHVLSPCVEFNKEITYKSLTQLVEPLPEYYSANERKEALTFTESQNPIFYGIFLREQQPTYEEHIARIQNELQLKADS